MTDEVLEIAQDDPNRYVVHNGKYAGLTIWLKELSPDFYTKMQKVYGTVKIPKPPKYEARTASGRVEEHYMDELAAQQTPGGEAKWLAYQQDLQEARAAQNDRVTMAMFYYAVDFELPDDGWETEHHFLGLTVPLDEQQKRAHFLTVELDPVDIAGLMAKTMRKVGINEELVKEAEDSFRGAIRNGPGQAGTVEDPGGDSAGTAKGTLATHRSIRGSTGRR